MFFIKSKHLVFFVFYFLSFLLGVYSFTKAEAVMDVDDILQDIIGIEEQRAREQSKPAVQEQQPIEVVKPKEATPPPTVVKEEKRPETVKKEEEKTNEESFKSIVSAKVLNLSDNATAKVLQQSNAMPEDVRQFLANHTRAIYLSLAIPNFDNNLEDYKKNSLENFKSVSAKNIDEYETFFIHKMYDVPFMYLNDTEKESLNLFLRAYAEDTGGIKTVIIYTRSYISRLDEDFNSVKGYLNAIYVHWLKNYILEELGSIARVVIIRMDNIPYDRIFLKLGNVKIESYKVRNIYNSDLITIQQWLYNNSIMEKIAVDEKSIIYKKFEESQQEDKSEEEEEDGIIF